MKNKRYEAYRRRSKAQTKKLATSRNWDPSLQIYIYHLYEGEHQRQKSYWDDVTFKYGSDSVYVDWTHPRYRYADQLDHQAYEYAIEKYPREKVDFFDKETAHYRKLGRSRKKITSWRCNMGEPDPEFYPTWRAKSKENCETSDLKIKCSFQLERVSYGLLLSVCCPLEVRSKEELKALADELLACLKDHGRFARQFGDYTYGADEYKLDNPADSSLDMNSMPVLI